MQIEFSAVISRRAVDCWIAQYPSSRDAAKARITEELLALSQEQRTATAISKIIGNKSWTHSFCAECHEYVDVAIRLGDDPSVTICLPCLKAASAAVQAAAALMTPAGAGDPQ